ncbi:hypothetical protein C8R47DRAFT_432100 [Mycena vitilis]|nr:hypothetical protein C8R47DRAFT_432100 [Mycena vitilis]
MRSFSHSGRSPCSLQPLERLHLESDSFHPPSSLDWLRPAAGHLSRLKTLRVVNSMGSWSFREIPDAFLTAPALREVVFTDGTLNAASPVSNNIPWAQLTHDRGRDHIQRQSKMLSAAPNLVECTMGVLVSGFAHNGESMILSRLRRLGVTNAVILDVLEAPALTSFTLFQTYSPETILSFAQRSFCRLTRLTECHPYQAHRPPRRTSIPHLSSPHLSFLPSPFPRAGCFVKCRDH